MRDASVACRSSGDDHAQDRLVVDDPDQLAVVDHLDGVRGLQRRVRGLLHDRVGRTSPGLRVESSARGSRMTYLSVSTCAFGTSLTKSRMYSSAGLRDDVGRRAHLHHLAIAHDQDAVAELDRLLQVVGDEDHRGLQLVPAAG